MPLCLEVWALYVIGQMSFVCLGFFKKYWVHKKGVIYFLAVSF